MFKRIGDFGGQTGVKSPPRAGPIDLRKPLTCTDIPILGGAEGTRTPDPLDANEVRYQLRYSPLRCAQGSKRRGASPNQVRGSGHCMDRNAAARIVHRLARRAAT